MNISKKDLRKLLEDTFRMGMILGYGVDHENITKDEAADPGQK